MLVLLVEIVVLSLVLLVVGESKVLFVAPIYFNQIKINQILQRKWTESLPFLNGGSTSVVWRGIEDVYHVDFDLMSACLLFFCELCVDFSHELLLVVDCVDFGIVREIDRWELDVQFFAQELNLFLVVNMNSLCVALHAAHVDRVRDQVGAQRYADAKKNCKDKLQIGVQFRRWIS